MTRHWLLAGLLSCLLLGCGGSAPSEPIVIPPPPTEIAITIEADTETQWAGLPIALSASATSDGQPVDIIGQGSWRLQNDSTASLSANGNEATLASEQAGHVTVYYQYLDAEASTTVAFEVPVAQFLAIGQQGAAVEQIIIADNSSTTVEALLSWSNQEQTALTDAGQWLSSDPAIFTVHPTPGSVTLQPVSPGTANLTVNAAELTASVAVEITATLQAVAIQFVSAPDQLVEDTFAPIVAQIEYNDGTYQDMNATALTSSDPAVADVTPGGLVLGMKAGTADITATTSNGIEAVHTVIVNPMAVVSLGVTAPTENLFTGTSTRVEAFGSADNNTLQPVAISNWQSTDPAVASVDADGVVTAIAPGVAKITAESQGLLADIDMTVSDDTLLALDLSVSPTPSGSSLTALPAGLKAYPKAVATFSSGKVQDISRSVSLYSSDPGVIDADTGAYITQAPGTADVWVEFGAVSSNLINWTTTGTTISAMVISPASIESHARAYTDVSAQFRLSDGTVIDADPSAFEWSVDAPEIISEVQPARFFAHKPGNAHLTATHLDDPTIASSASAHVRLAAPISIEIATEAGTLMSPGDTPELRLHVVFEDGSESWQQLASQWVVSDPSIAKISLSDGQVRLHAIATGQAEITAYYRGLEHSLMVNVLNAEVSSGWIEVQSSNPGHLWVGDPTIIKLHTLLSDGSEYIPTGNITWSSSDVSIASIDTTTVPYIRGHQEGTITLTAEFGDHTFTTTLTVEAPPQMAQMTIFGKPDGHPVSLSVGEKKLVEILVSFEDGTYRFNPEGVAIAVDGQKVQVEPGPRGSFWLTGLQQSALDPNGIQYTYHDEQGNLLASNHNALVIEPEYRRSGLAFVTASPDELLEYTAGDATFRFNLYRNHGYASGFTVENWTEEETNHTKFIRYPDTFIRNFALTDPAEVPDIGTDDLISVDAYANAGAGGTGKGGIIVASSGADPDDQRFMMALPHMLSYSPDFDDITMMWSYAINGDGSKDFTWFQRQMDDIIVLRCAAEASIFTPDCTTYPFPHHDFVSVSLALPYGEAGHVDLGMYALVNLTDQGFIFQDLGADDSSGLAASLTFPTGGLDNVPQHYTLISEGRQVLGGNNALFRLRIDVDDSVEGEITPTFRFVDANDPSRGFTVIGSVTVTRYTPE